MQAWKNIHTGKLHDIQTIPGPLPEGYNAEDWELINYSWNFHDLDAQDPGVSLREIMILLGS